MTQETFLHFSRCAKAGFLFVNKSNLLDLDYERKKYLANEFKEAALRIIENYKHNAQVEILSNYEFKTPRGDTAIADIIVKSDNETTLISLVCSTEEPDWLQIKNLAYTYYVANNCGMKIDAANIAFVRQEYSCSGQITCEFLRIKSYTKKVKELQYRIGADIKMAKEKLRNNSLPANKIDHCCRKPGICPFYSHCVKEEFPAKNSISELNDLSFYRKLYLYRDNKTDYSKGLPSNFIISDKSKKQISYTLCNKIIKEKRKIGEWINKISARKFIWFLDMESDAPAVPIVNETKPFTMFPFLYTLQYYNTNTETTGSFQNMISSSLTFESIKDFTGRFINHIQLNDEAPIVVSNMKKIKECLNNLAIVCPEYKEVIDKISKKLIDLRAVFVDHLYYDPKFKGSYYFKDIIPIMCPEISYSHLLIKSGTQAQYEFRKLTTEAAVAKIQMKIELEKYSLMDTTSLSSVFKFLKMESNSI